MNLIFRGLLRINFSNTLSNLTKSQHELSLKINERKERHFAPVPLFEHYLVKYREFEMLLLS